MTVQKHYVIVANHDDATAYTYTNHGSALVEVKKWHNEFSGATKTFIQINPADNRLPLRKYQALIA